MRGDSTLASAQCDDVTRPSHSQWKWLPMSARGHVCGVCVLRMLWYGLSSHTPQRTPTGATHTITPLSRSTHDNTSNSSNSNIEPHRALLCICWASRLSDFFELLLKKVDSIFKLVVLFCCQHLFRFYFIASSVWFSSSLHTASKVEYFTFRRYLQQLQTQPQQQQPQIFALVY